MTNAREFDYVELIALQDVGLLPTGTYYIGRDEPDNLKGMWHRVSSRELPLATAALEIDNEVPLALASPNCHIVPKRGVVTLNDSRPLSYGPSFAMIQEGVQVMRKHVIHGAYAPDMISQLPVGVYQIENVILPSKLPPDVRYDANLPHAVQAEMQKWPLIALGWTPFTVDGAPTLKPHDTVYVLGLGRLNGLGSPQQLHALRITLVKPQA